MSAARVDESRPPLNSTAMGTSARRRRDTASVSVSRRIDAASCGVTSRLDKRVAGSDQYRFTLFRISSLTYANDAAGKAYIPSKKVWWSRSFLPRDNQVAATAGLRARLL